MQNATSGDQSAESQGDSGDGDTRGERRAPVDEVTQAGGRPNGENSDVTGRPGDRGGADTGQPTDQEQKSAADDRTAAKQSSDEGSKSGGAENRHQPDSAQDEPGKSTSGGSANPSSGSGGGPQSAADNDASAGESGGASGGVDDRQHSPRPDENHAADAANLEYARQATDLVLDYLADQQDKPDPRLLEKLNWTPEELRQFLSNWRRFKQDAREEAGQRKVEDRLRGLGLQPREGKLREGGTGSEQRLGGLSESGAQVPAPPEYREQFDAFRKGRARF
jgi:hypothetical protein